MKRKEEVETMIAAIARRIKPSVDHIGNGNTDDVEYIHQTVENMKLFIDYVSELNELVPQRKIDVIFSERLNELK